MNDFYNLAPTEFSAATIALNIIFVMALEMAIVYIYKKTHQGLSYSSSFVFTFVLIGVIGTVVMMVVQHNLARAFGLLGAFSLIRFRTILKETRDIAFLFFALAVGVAVGTNNYAIALISTLMISPAIWFFYRYNIGHARSGLGHILVFNAREGFNLEEGKTILKNYASDFELLQARTHGEIMRYVFAVRPKKDIEPTEILNEFHKNKSVADIEFISGERGVEY